MTIFDDIRKDREAGTPDLGGWFWHGGRDFLSLATRHGGRRYVMGFKRKGLQGAQPMFQIKGAMVGAIDDLTEYAVGDGTARGQKQADGDVSVYRMDVVGVDHPDARRIARVPRLERIALEMEQQIWIKVGEYLAGQPHSEVSEKARRGIETAIKAAFRAACGEGE